MTVEERHEELLKKIKETLQKDKANIRVCEWCLTKNPQRLEYFQNEIKALESRVLIFEKWLKEDRYEEQGLHNFYDRFYRA